jgi:hypothetical protein
MLATSVSLIVNKDVREFPVLTEGYIIQTVDP